jgi:hypothetical protein
MSIGRRFGLLLSAILGLVGLIMQVGPHEAAANVCQWLNLVFGSCSQQISDLHIPNATPWALYGIAAISLVWGVWPLTEKFRKAGQDTANLHRLTSDELKIRAISLANEMRAFDAAIQTEDSRLFTRHYIPTLGKSQEDIQRSWRDGNQIRWDFGARKQQEFNVRYRPQALAMRTELRARLGSLIDDFEKSEVSTYGRMLEHGAFAGPHPITRFADYLDALGRKLP